MRPIPAVVTRVAAMTLTLACAAASMSCGTSTPTTPGGNTCRTYAAKATGSSVSNLGLNTSGLMLTGAFSTSTMQFTSTVIYPNGSTCTTVVFTYPSVAAFVGEVRVVPPVPMVTQTTTTGGPACGTGTSSQIYSYGSEGRLTQIVQGAQTTTYTAWDSTGRPTAGVISGVATLTTVYDDASRTTTTQTMNAAGQSTTTTLTYDANGIELTEVDASGPSVTTVTWTINSTAMVCS